MAHWHLLCYVRNRKKKVMDVIGIFATDRFVDRIPSVEIKVKGLLIFN